MALASGTRLGPYAITTPLGAGGMGEVYKATDTRLDRTVAVKVLPEHVASDPELKQRFEREAKTLAALSHPHICPVFDVGSQDGIAFLVMEYLEGETLEQRLKKGALPIDQALPIGIQVVDALAAAHRAGIVHRDLKPGNVMLTKSSAKLLDFGLAKTGAHAIAGSLSMLPTTPPGLTAQGTILGTFQYMAPEQLEGKEADARADLFAFGALLYEMLTGKKAFEGKSHASLISAILKDEPPPISQAQPLAPPLLDRVVKKCLAKDPEARWHSAHDLHDELIWIGEVPSHVALAAPAVRRGSRERFAWIVAALSLVIIAALVVPATLYVRRAAPEPVVTRLDVVTPATSDAFSFALSADGRKLVFVANGEKGSLLWVRSLDQVTAQPLAGTEGASLPFWAPDGGAVGFFADGKLKRIDFAGGAPQILTDAPQGRGGTWGRDGVIVFAPSSTGGLMSVVATGGTPVPVTSLAAGQGSHRWPQFLPDGRRFLFLMFLGEVETHGVYVASLDDAEPTLVLAAETAAAYARPGYLLRVSQGVLVAQSFDETRATLVGEPVPLAQAVGENDGTARSAFSVSATGVLAHRAGAGGPRQLVWVDRLGKMQVGVGVSDENAPANLALASDGQRVAVQRTVQGNLDVWLMDIGRNVTSRFTFDGASDTRPVWSPDGRQVAFASSRKGRNGDLFVKPASGAADEQPLLLNAQDKAPVDWSPDGRVLLFAAQDPKTASDLWALPLTADRKPFPVVQTGFDEIEGQFSPDGRWLAYASNESGRYEIYVRPFADDGGKWQVSTGGGTQPRWRPDGEELFYIAPDNRMMAVPLGLAADGRSVEAGAPAALFPTRLVTGANVAVGGFNARAQYAVARDGRFLMTVTADDAVASPITIVQNWDAALKK
ncbi:MAG: protein kinase domain-containing protein [Vicinamibacterales bacterium]